MKKQYLIGLVMLLLAGIAAVYVLKSGDVPGKDMAHPAQQTQSAAGPQGPAASQDTPKAQEGAEEEAPTVEIPLDKQQLIGLKTTEVSVRPLQKTIRTVGLIEYDERRLSTVNTKFEGWIEKLYVDYTGRYVKKGELLAEVYSPELMATQQELINAVKWTRQNREIRDEEIGKMLARDAGSILEASRQRLRLWDISEAQIRKIEETGTPIKTVAVYSPVNGYVIQKMAMKGLKIMPGEKLFDIADLSTLWIVADVYENELSTVKPGEKAKITLSYFPGKEFSSRIDYIYPSISGTTRTAKVRFEIPNPGGQLKPQMYTNIEIKTDLGSKLAVPDDSVIDTGTRQVVYVDKGDGYFEPREVLLGLRTEGWREVISGLKAGEKVVSSAAFLIDSEAQLKDVKPLSGGHKH
jgi:membrane fusion protein, copper/silver efflux system